MTPRKIPGAGWKAIKNPLDPAVTAGAAGSRFGMKRDLGHGVSVMLLDGGVNGILINRLAMTNHRARAPGRRSAVSRIERRGR